MDFKILPGPREGIDKPVAKVLVLARCDKDTTDFRVIFAVFFHKKRFAFLMLSCA